MKNFNKISLLILVAIAAGCNSKSDEAHSSNAHGEHMASSEHESHDRHTSIPHDEPTDMSLYQVSSQWTTQQGNTIELQDLQGKVQLVAMVYTTCQYACPRIVADLEHIQSALKERGIDEQAHFVLVSIDPKIDTVGRLQEFAAENNMDSDQWALLNGAESDILELAALLGVKYKKTTATDYAHSNIITVLDQQGEVVHQQTGLGGDAAKTIEVIEGLVR